MNIEDDACCPDCHSPINVDKDLIEIYIGTCACGCELVLEPDGDGIEWGRVQ
jgi:hypothetical protein